MLVHFDIAFEDENALKTNNKNKQKIIVNAYSNTDWHHLNENYVHATLKFVLGIGVVIVQFITEREGEGRDKVNFHVCQFG